jgi:hypothetical protein
VSYTAADITELDDVQHTRLRLAVNLDVPSALKAGYGLERVEKVDAGK